MNLQKATHQAKEKNHLLLLSDPCFPQRKFQDKPEETGQGMPTLLISPSKTQCLSGRMSMRTRWGLARTTQSPFGGRPGLVPTPSCTTNPTLQTQGTGRHPASHHRAFALASPSAWNAAPRTHSADFRFNIPSSNEAPATTPRPAVFHVLPPSTREIMCLFTPPLHRDLQHRSASGHLSSGPCLAGSVQYSRA